MIDPDIRAIRRKRRQEGRCVACGVWASGAVLCRACRADQAYCPMCEDLHIRTSQKRRDRSSEYCTGCNTRRARRLRGQATAAEYAAARARKRRQLLPELIKRYRKGENLGKVAKALGLKRSQIDHLISQARKRGEWPEELRRYK